MRAALLAFGLALAASAHAGRQAAPRFDHEKHAKVFPGCTGCHAGIADSTRPLWPTSASCATCHDGTVEKRVDWNPPTETRATNLRFTHLGHARSASRKLASDSTLACAECHMPKGRAWMHVEAARPEPCLSCHGIRAEHVAAPDTACATCHLPLAEAAALPEARVATFVEPPSHKVEGFLDGKGHGAQSKPKGGDHTGVAASCATCHARDFCAQCHVNAPEVPAIQALAPDPRSVALKAELKAPAGHDYNRFLQRHGEMARKHPAGCAACHTQESCIACHRAQPSVAAAMPVAGPGRSPGAHVVRTMPVTHGKDFVDRHGPVASSSPRACSACHSRTECLECHRPNASNNGSYHPGGFLTSHPAAAYNRESDCSECHNAGQFCSTCHQETGLTPRGPLQGGFHENRPGFIAGHGQAARQSMETCVTCHSERDCLACHSAQGGGRFNPHGPGFDAERLRRRNPQMCSACHGRNIPGG